MLSSGKVIEHEKRGSKEAKRQSVKCILCADLQRGAEEIPRCFRKLFRVLQEAFKEVEGDWVVMYLIKHSNNHAQRMHGFNSWFQFPTPYIQGLCFVNSEEGLMN